MGIRLKCLDLNQLMTQAVPQRLESIQLMAQAAFQELTLIHPELTHVELTPELTHDSTGCPTN